MCFEGWFGPRWLRFEGKLFGALGCWSVDNAVIAPFHPHRVRAELDVTPSPDEPAVFVERPAVKPFHGERRSETNIRLRLPAATPNGTLAAWLSEPEAPDAAASLMVYLVRPDTAPLQWYVQAHREAGELTVSSLGISAAELQWLLRGAAA